MLLWCSTTQRLCMGDSGCFLVLGCGRSDFGCDGVVSRFAVVGVVVYHWCMTSGRVESDEAGRTAARAARPCLSLGFGGAAVVAVNSVGVSVVSVSRGAQRPVGRQRWVTLGEPRSGSLAGSAATRSVPGRGAPRAAPRMLAGLYTACSRARHELIVPGGMLDWVKDQVRD